MSYIVDIRTQAVDFAPSSVVDEIIQNVRTLLSTYVFSVPLDRTFGLSEDIVDRPVTPDVMAKLQGEIFDVIKKYEPRVTVTAIGLIADERDSSIVRPHIEIEIKEGVL